MLRTALRTWTVASTILLLALPGTMADQQGVCLESRTITARTLVYVNHGTGHRAWLYLSRDTVGAGPGIVETGTLTARSPTVVQRIPEDSSVAIGLSVASDEAIWLAPGSPGPPPSDKPGLRYTLCFGNF